jgi:hypothetical protein
MIIYPLSCTASVRDFEEGHHAHSVHLTKSHEIDVNLRCNKEAVMNEFEFDAFLAEMHRKLWRQSNVCIKNLKSLWLPHCYVRYQCQAHETFSEFRLLSYPPTQNNIQRFVDVPFRNIQFLMDKLVFNIPQKRWFCSKNWERD